MLQFFIFFTFYMSLRIVHFFLFSFLQSAAIFLFVFLFFLFFCFLYIFKNCTLFFSLMVYSLKVRSHCDGFSMNFTYRQSMICSIISTSPPFLFLSCLYRIGNLQIGLKENNYNALSQQIKRKY